MDGAASDATPRDSGAQDGQLSDGGADDGSSPDSGTQDAMPQDGGSSDGGLDYSKVQVRVGPAVVVRGPAGDELDTQFNAIRLPSGTMRGFSANASTYAIDGADLWHMSWARTKVLAPGPADSASSCGRWLNATRRQGDDLYGFVHVESQCDYAHGQTHKAMHLAVSHDDGLHWSMVGPIVTGNQQPALGTITGTGDGAVIDGEDGYLYMYLLRNTDWRTVVARASVTDFGPGSWKKYYNGTFSSPGLGGDADALGALGQGAGYWIPGSAVVLLHTDKWSHGLELSMSPDKVTFTTLSEPLIPIDDTQWKRPAPTDLVAYPTVLDPSDGSRQIGQQFIVGYIYLMPGETFANRYLVLRQVHMWLGSTPPGVAQVGVALTRYHTPDNHLHWTTTSAVPTAWGNYVADSQPLGYLLTTAHPTWPSTKIEECVGDWPGHPDHILTSDGTCESAGYTRMRTVGWLLKTQHPGTVPVYRCYNAQYKDHFASTSADCEGLGDQEFVMGWAMAG